MAIERIADARSGRNGRHALAGLPRQLVVVSMEMLSRASGRRRARPNVRENG